MFLMSFNIVEERRQIMEDILFSVITWNFRGPLIRTKFVGSFAFVDAKGRFPDAGEKERMTISSVWENPLLFGHWDSITEPNDLGFGGSMNCANDFGFIVFPGVDECLLLLNHRSIWKKGMFSKLSTKMHYSLRNASFSDEAYENRHYVNRYGSVFGKACYVHISCLSRKQWGPIDVRLTDWSEENLAVFTNTLTESVFFTP